MNDPLLTRLEQRLRDFACGAMGNTSPRGWIPSVYNCVKHYDKAWDHFCEVVVQQFGIRPRTDETFHELAERIWYGFPTD